MSSTTTAQAKRTRNYSFTLNNYVEEDIPHILSVECSYILMGKEVAASGTPHLQGTIVFKHAKTFTAAQHILHPRMHLEPTIDVWASIIYCKKDGNFVEKGTPPAPQTAQGHRGAEGAQFGELGGEVGGRMEQDRWALALQQARETGDVEDSQIAFMHVRVIEHHHMKHTMSLPLEDTAVRHLWYWGESGTGKSYKARTENPDAYLKMCNKWWDGYANEDVVLIEDFDKAHTVLGHHLKIWADRYPFLAEKKGTAMRLRPRLIIVTSNWHPKQIWHEEETLGPMMRRFKCTQFRKLSENQFQEVEDVVPNDEVTFVLPGPPVLKRNKRHGQIEETQAVEEDSSTEPLPESQEEDDI